MRFWRKKSIGVKKIYGRKNAFFGVKN